MTKLLVIISILFCAGCVKREPQVVKVVDAADFHPIQGAKVWMQPWAPIHPFWPAGDSGVTDEKGEVTLLLPRPSDFWFYFSSVKADGYTEAKPSEEVKDPNHLLHVSQNTRC